MVSCLILTKTQTNPFGLLLSIGSQWLTSTKDYASLPMLYEHPSTTYNHASTCVQIYSNVKNKVFEKTTSLVKGYSSTYNIAGDPAYPLKVIIPPT